MPILIGTTAIDIPLHFPPNKLKPFAWFGADEEAARAAYGAIEGMENGGPIRMLLSIGADMTMHEPARFVAKKMTEAGHPAWLYRFTYTAESVRPDSVAQSHAGELPWFFNQLEAKYGDAVTANDQAMADAFNTYVANFIKTGNPNDEGLPEWQQFDPAVHNLLNFSLEGGPVFGEDPRPTVELVERAHAAQGE
jgi:para-nitrobenzyl esterase